MLKTAKVVGLNSDTDAALALAASRPSSDLAESGNGQSTLHLFAIVSVSGDDAFTKVRLALTEAENAFFISDKSIADRLPDLQTLIRDSLSGMDGINSVIAATQEENANTFFYFLGTGQALQSYLIREGKKTDLMNVSAGSVISGIIKPGDRIIICTNTLNDILQDDLKVLEKISVEALEDEVVSRLPEAENYPVAAVVLEKEIAPPEDTFKDDHIELPEVSKKPLFKYGSISPKEIIRSIIALIIRLMPKTKKSLGIIGIILLLIISTWIGFSYFKGKEGETKSKYESLLTEANQEYEKAVSLKDSNTQEAIISLNKSRDLVNQAIAANPKEGKAQDLKKKIEEGSPLISKITNITDFPLWLDLNLIKSGFSAQRMSDSLGNLLLLDQNKKSVVKINLSTKAFSPIASEDKIGQAEFASLNGELAFVYSKDKGLIKFDTKNNTSSVSANVDKDWGIISALQGFGGNIYLLDTLGNQIWKYLPTVSGYSDKREYLKTKANFEGAINMKIDSSVWVMKNGGEILKYTQGASDYFSLNGLDKGVKDPKAFYVSDSTDNFYILDSGNKRLLILDKKGNYLSQYQSEKFSSILDFIVSEADKKIYLLDGSKIYQLDLK